MTIFEKTQRAWQRLFFKNSSFDVKGSRTNLRERKNKSLKNFAIENAVFGV